MWLSRSAAFGLAMGWAAPAMAATYTMTSLGGFGGTVTTAAGINDSGQIAGNSQDAGGTSYAYFYANGQMTSLGTHNGIGGKARAINSSGVVEGNLSNGDLFIWNNGTFTDYGAPPAGTNFIKGNGFNDSGLIAGQDTMSNGITEAFVFNPANSGSYMLLGTLGGMPSTTQFSYASSINSSGQVEGDSINASNQDHAFIWTPNGSTGTWNDLGTLGGAASSGIAVNNLGHATGTADIGGGIFHVFLYDRPDKINSNVMVDCGTLGGDYGNAGGMNNEDQIVGYCELADNVTDHAFLYSDGVMADLNTFIPANSGWTLTGASGINDAGEIVASGVNSSGAIESFLLTPSAVPEPSAVTLTAGAVALLSRRPRRI